MHNKQLQRKTIKMFVYLCVYRILLDIVYSRIISKHVYYEGYIYQPTTINITISWIIFLASLFAIKPIYTNSKNKISALVVYILFMISFVPFTTMVSVGCFEYSFIISNCVYWIILLFSEQYFCNKSQMVKFKMGDSDIVISPQIISFIGVTMVLMVLYISFRYTGFSINLDIYAVYSIRERNISYMLPTIVQYLFEWEKAIAPIFLVYCIYKKRIPSAFIYFIVLLLSAGIDGTKTTLFMPFVTVVLVLIYDRLPHNMESVYITIGLILMSIVSIAENIVLKTYNIAYIVVRRMLFTPNMISNYYVDFFSKNTPDFFRASFLRHFGFVSPYTEGSKRIGEFIADLYYYRSGVNFNNGLISDAITNLGVVGIVVMPIILTLVLRLFDNCSEKLPRKMTIALVLYLVTNLIGSFLTTMLLTHGLIAVLFVLYLFSRSKEFRLREESDGLSSFKDGMKV